MIKVSDSRGKLVIIEAPQDDHWRHHRTLVDSGTLCQENDTLAVLFQEGGQWFCSAPHNGHSLSFQEAHWPKEAAMKLAIAWLERV